MSRIKSETQHSKHFNSRGYQELHYGCARLVDLVRFVSSLGARDVVPASTRVTGSAIARNMLQRRNPEAGRGATNADRNC